MEDLYVPVGHLAMECVDIRGYLHEGRKILEGGTTFFVGFTGRNFGPCGAQVDKELEMAEKI